MAFDMAYLRAIWKIRENPHLQPVQLDRRTLQRIAFMQTGNQMQRADDMHMWCEDSDGTVQDKFCMDSERALVWGRDKSEPPLTIVRRAWKTFPPLHREMLESEKSKFLRYAREYSKENRVSVNSVLQECLDDILNNLDKFPNRCISIAALQHLLHGWTVKVGSLGWDCDLPNVQIWWEFGNGGSECPPEFCHC